MYHTITFLKASIGFKKQRLLDIDWQSCYVWIWWRCQAVKVCDIFVLFLMACYNFRLNCCFCENVTRCKKTWHVAKISQFFLLIIEMKLLIICIRKLFGNSILDQLENVFPNVNKHIPLQATNMFFRCIHWLIFSYITWQ